MKDAFGVQREIPATEIVMGTSVIMQEFSPSTIPEPSPIDDIRQQTTDVEQQNLQVNDAVMDAVEQKIQQEVQQQAEELKEQLKDEIEEGLVTVETEERKIIIRIQEKGSFASGSASLDPDFGNVMNRISDAVAQAPGHVVIAGHTDNIPISTKRFRSNWELSSARAVSVAHSLMKNPAVDPARVVIEGHADTTPIALNDSAKNRAKNRRVELIIERGDDLEQGQTLLIRDPS